MNEDNEDQHAKDYEASLRDLSMKELEEMTGGCTELSCMYHGPINFEIKRRLKKR